MNFGRKTLILCLLSEEYIIDLWEARKVKLYGKPSTQLQSQSSAGHGDSRDDAVDGGQRYVW